MEVDTRSHDYTADRSRAGPLTFLGDFRGYLQRALPALGFIQQLYAVEREAKGRDAETRRALRQEQARPVLARFRARAAKSGHRPQELAVLWQ